MHYISSTTEESKTKEMKEVFFRELAVNIITTMDYDDIKKLFTTTETCYTSDEKVTYKCEITV